MIKKFNKSNLPIVRATMDCALKDVGEKLGVRMAVGNGSYTPNEVTFKVKVVILDETGVSKADKSDFMSNALYRGFAAEDFGREFTSKGRQFKITGWDRRKWKFPVTVTEIATGDPWHFPVGAVLRALGKGDKIQGGSNQVSHPKFTANS